MCVSVYMYTQGRQLFFLLVPPTSDNLSQAAQILFDIFSTFQSCAHFLQNVPWYTNVNIWHNEFTSKHLGDV